MIKRYLIKKILLSLVTVFCVATVVFFLLRMRAGGPASALLGDYASQEAINDFNKQLGLDKPILVQYGIYIINLVRGDLGVSFTNGQAVLKLLWQNLPFTLHIVIGSMVIGVPIGLALGILASIKKGLFSDNSFRIFSLTCVSVPTFVIATVLILIFSVYLGWLPVTEIGEISTSWGKIRGAIMPSIALALFLIGYLSRLTRTCFLEILVQDYIRTARSLGIPDYLLYLKYGLRNALISISTVMGIYVIGLMGASPVVETVFARPGIGSLLVRSIQQSDFPVTQGALIFFAVLVMMVNLSIDIMYGFIDPRIKADV